MSRFSRCLAFLIISQTIISIAHAQTATVIAANLAASHVGEYATVEGVVAKVFTSKNGNTFLNIGATYPNQTFTGWIPPTSPVSKSPLLTGIEGKRVKIIPAESSSTKESRKSGSMLPLSSRSNDRL